MNRRTRIRLRNRWPEIFADTLCLAAILYGAVWAYGIFG